MFVTLEAGRYTLICECGKQTLPILLYRRHKRVSTHCFYCNNNGKYIKIMEHNLLFLKNWNNKLDCDCFTTLRLSNPKKYYKGALVNVVLNNESKGKATIISVNHFTIDQINEFVAGIDTGLSAEECRKYIMKMYSYNTKIDWFTQKLDFCLLKYEKK